MWQWGWEYMKQMLAVFSYAQHTPIYRNLIGSERTLNGHTTLGILDRLETRTPTTNAPVEKKDLPKYKAMQYALHTRLLYQTLSLCYIHFDNNCFHPYSQTSDTWEGSEQDETIRVLLKMICSEEIKITTNLQ
eukprot:Gb_01960 [translate_table: standard]